MSGVRPKRTPKTYAAQSFTTSGTSAAGTCQVGVPAAGAGPRQENQSPVWLGRNQHCMEEVGVLAEQKAEST